MPIREYKEEEGDRQKGKVEEGQREENKVIEKMELKGKGKGKKEIKARGKDGSLFCKCSESCGGRKGEEGENLNHLLTTVLQFSTNLTLAAVQRIIRISIKIKMKPEVKAFAGVLAGLRKHFRGSSEATISLLDGRFAFTPTLVRDDE